jgi:hypothetical protein
MYFCLFIRSHIYIFKFQISYICRRSHCLHANIFWNFLNSYIVKNILTFHHRTHLPTCRPSYWVPSLKLGFEIPPLHKWTTTFKVKWARWRPWSCHNLPEQDHHIMALRSASNVTETVFLFIPRKVCFLLLKCQNRVFLWSSYQNSILKSENKIPHI